MKGNTFLQPLIPNPISGKHKARIIPACATPNLKKTSMGKKSIKVAIVTGGASGIGRAVCLKLFEEGHHVIVCDTNLDLARTIEVETLGRDNQWLPKYLDVSNPKLVKSLLGNIFKDFGRIDILVNSAGVTMPPTLLVEKKESDFKKIIDIHLMGTFYCMKEAAARMIERRFGRIINISSRAGVYGLYGKSDYSAAKAGIIGLTFAAAKELYKNGITVNVIAPAAIRTPLSIKNISKQKGRRARLDMIVGEPVDLANLISFLSKEESYLINGSVFILDAGGHLWHGMDEKFSRMIRALD